MVPGLPTRTRRAALAAAAALLLAGCGGGLYVSVGDDDWDDWDDPPQVTLVASLSSAAPGSLVRLAAAASDDYGVDRVLFYRLEPDGRSTLLDTDRSPPYETDTVLPGGSAGSVRYFARAVDGLGQTDDSDWVEVRLR